MPKLRRTYLYSAAYPKGFLHEGLTEGEEAALLEEGWYDHPAKVPGAPESAKNMTGGMTHQRPSAQPEIKYSTDDLRAMLLSGKDMKGSMLARLATALELEVPEGIDDEGLRQIITDAIGDPSDASKGAGSATTARDVRKLTQGNALTGDQQAPPPAPLKPAKEPAKKAPAKKAGARK